MTGWKDQQTLFHRTLPATTRGATSTTAVDWHLSQKFRVQCQFNQKLLHHSEKSVQFINSFLIKQILGSNELNRHDHF